MRTPNTSIRSSILIVDGDPGFADSMSDHPKYSSYPILRHHSARNAQLAISQSDLPLLGVFVNPSISDEGCISVIRSAHIHRPALPVYVVLDDGAPDFLSAESAKRLGVRRTLRKPIDYNKMIELVGPVTSRFDMSNLNTQPSDPREGLGHEFSAEDSCFVGIRAKEFLSGSKSFFDVFVRLPSARYVKLLQAGDAFTADRLTEYLQKGVTHFYIKKEVQESYVAYCDQLTTVLLANRDVSLDVKTMRLMNQGEETMSFLRFQGLNEDTVRHATRFVTNVRDFVQKTLALSKDGSPLDSFLANPAAIEHGAGTSALACILGNHLDISMERPVQILGVAGLLHDVGLFTLPQELWHEDEAKMTPEQVTLYQTHPKLGADILRELPAIEPVVIQAVECHHVRQRGLGFGTEGRGKSLSKVSEIVSICGDLQHSLTRHQFSADGMQALLADLEKNVFPGFSRQIVYAFRSAFFPSKKDSSKRGET